MQEAKQPQECESKERALQKALSALQRARQLGEECDWLGTGSSHRSADKEQREYLAQIDDAIDAVQQAGAK